MRQPVFDVHDLVHGAIPIVARASTRPSTDANDSAESTAILRIFGDRVPLSSPKSFLGHTLGASGIIEVIITLLLAEEGLVPPTLNFKGVRPGCTELDYVPNSPRPAENRVFLANNYGFGGNNASLVVRRGVQAQTEPRRAEREEVVIVGVGCVTHAGLGADSLAQARREGRPAAPTDGGIRMPTIRLTEARMRSFARSSPMIKAAILAADEVFTAIGLDAEEQAACGMIAGVCLGAQNSTEKYMDSVFNAGPEFASALHFPMTTLNATGGQVSIAFGLKGFNTTVYGSAAALFYARRLIEAGRQERVLVVTADELSPLLIDFYRRIGWPVDGLPGEGAVAILLESARSAAAKGRRALAKLDSFTLGNGGRIASIDPAGRPLAASLAEVLSNAGCAPSDIPTVLAQTNGRARCEAALDRAISAAGLGDRTRRQPAAAVTGRLLSGSALLTALDAVHAHGETGGRVVIGGYEPYGDHFAGMISGVGVP